MSTILFVGDVCGRPGRLALQKFLPKAIAEFKPDYIIVNGENASHGDAVFAEHFREWQKMGVQLVTGGNHTFSNQKHLPLLISDPPLAIRPANFHPDLPGVGTHLLTSNNGNSQILVVNLQGRIFMSQHIDCPFRKLENLLTELLPNLLKQPNFEGVFIDFHAEATSEKEAMFYFAEKFPSIIGIVGTHTHVQTGDAQIGPTGIGYLTDAGMTGARRSVIGHEVSGVLDKIIKQVSQPKNFPMDAGLQFCAVVLKIEGHKCRDITPIFWHES